MIAAPRLRVLEVVLGCGPVPWPATALVGRDRRAADPARTPGEHAVGAPVGVLARGGALGALSVRSSPIAPPGRTERSGAPDRSLWRLAAACTSAYLVGSIPVASLVARARGGADLGADGGTVSGSALYAREGFGALALAGCAELAKGAYGPLAAGGGLAGRALAAAAAIVGHNWSPWLGFSGGRGVSLVLGAGAACAPEVTAVVGLGLGMGRLVRQSGLGTFFGLAAVPLACAWRRHGALPRHPAVLIARLLADRDEWPCGRAR